MKRHMIKTRIGRSQKLRIFQKLNSVVKNVGGLILFKTLCKSYQESEAEQVDINTRQEQDHDDETNEMMTFIKSMSTQDSLRQQALLLGEDLSDNDTYWSEDEFAVIKAYYENEQEDEEEESETRNLIIILKQQQTDNTTTEPN
ncbi:hypothetical protein BDF21DRAFT_394648 [Thamnidium elegans]|nr:hypothetical protein BDF21DRAFT_394648 [Thamnidium elegans]